MRNPVIHTMIRSTLSLFFICAWATGNAAAVEENDTPAPRVERQGPGGKVRFIGTAAGQTLPVKVPLTNRTLRAFQGGGSTLPADAALQQYAPLFGVQDPARDMILAKQHALGGWPSVSLYQQQYRGLPVIGGELLVNLDAKGQLRSMNGEVAPDLQLDTRAKIDAVTAQQIASAALAKWYGVSVQTLVPGEATLSVYVPKLLVPGSLPPQLVWQLEVTRTQEPDYVSEWVLVNAHSGGIAVHFSQIDHIRNRVTFSANGTGARPGSLICKEDQPDCTNGADPDADFAHVYAGNTYDFYKQHHNRDGIDGNGGEIISTVHWNDGVSCPNAFWSGTQMVYCDYFSQADDVVAHELTHGVTEHTSNLLYYYQSGAINESLSDVWGEFVDLTNGRGHDSSDVRWLLGEDLPGIGAIRNMKTPNVFPYYDPDKMTSTHYYAGSGDNGGVHTNSGINNKAAYLMTDGEGSIRGLGIDKVAAIYYEVQSNLLTSASDYLDLYNALYQGCQNLVGGSDKITVADCEEVRKATEAVEMNQRPNVNANPEAALCPIGLVPGSEWFKDDFENNAGQWDFTASTGTALWKIGTGYATSAVHQLQAPNASVKTDTVAAMKTGVTLTANSRLFFRHAFGFEAGYVRNSSVRQYFDGGLLEYSENGGPWKDASGLIAEGQKATKTISTALDNPNGGRTAFVDESHGYVSSRLNLSSLSGNVRFRFRLSSDSSIAGPLGWVVDDVRIYDCVAAALTANAGKDQNVYVDQTVTLDGSQSLGAVNSYLWSQTGGTKVTLSNVNSAKPTFTALAPVSPATAPETLTFQLTVDDIGGGISTATVNVIVSEVPTLVADAGPDQNANAGQGIILDGSGSSGAIVSYAWTQTGGTSVTLDGASTPTPGFSAPLNAETLSFQLTVTDVKDIKDTATVDVTLTIPSLKANAGSDFRVAMNKRGQLSAQASQGAILAYRWRQVSGPAVTLNGANSATPNFTAPNAVTTLGFNVTVTDSSGAESSDTVNASVYNPTPPPRSSGGGGALHPLLALAGLLLGLGLRRRKRPSTGASG